VEKVKASRCRECGTLVDPAATGRPAVYCSPVCRRAAEYDLRRSQVLLTRAQRCEQDAGLRLMTASSYRLDDEQKALDYWRAEVKRLRDKLRAMLAGVIDEDEGGTLGADAPSPPRAS
jgi:hypothetical protein